jgi:hypothetical protein
VHRLKFSVTQRFGATDNNGEIAETFAGVTSPHQTLLGGDGIIQAFFCNRKTLHGADLFATFQRNY